MSRQQHRIPIDEFAANAAAIIDRVLNGGESVELEKSGETVAVVSPTASERKTGLVYRKGRGPWIPVADMEQFKQRLRSERPSKEELVRRKRLAARILANRQHRNIAPLTSADLVHMARAEAEHRDDRAD
ncbi:MAG: hypothetical protein CL878_15030 [Dehalococcoidia bacterium]|nr:hypothetical protein [Dehalococcoidia bacterium]